MSADHRPESRPSQGAYPSVDKAELGEEKHRASRRALLVRTGVKCKRVLYGCHGFNTLLQYSEKGAKENAVFCLKWKIGFKQESVASNRFCKS